MYKHTTSGFCPQGHLVSPTQIPPGIHLRVRGGWGPLEQHTRPRGGGVP